jgi:regulator of protease activity HflC (stomatin/prohibitin superfamily)
MPVIIGAGFAALVAVMTLFGGFYTVSETERAVVTRFGAFSHVAGPGFHLKLPLIDTVHEYNVTQQSVRVDDSETYTIDNQVVLVDMVVNYEIPDAGVERIYREVPDFARRLSALAVDRMKQSFGRRNIADVPQQRGQIAREILDVVQQQAQELLGLRVIDLQLTDLQYTPAYRQAVDLAAVAKAQVETAEQQRRQAEVVGQTQVIQARAAANQAIERARGEAESRLAIAQAEARSIQLRGEAEAASIAAQARALGENPLLVALEQARKWNGQLPQQILGTAPVPFMPVTALPAGR